MKRLLLVISAGALTLVLAGGAFFAFRSASAGPVVGPISMSSIPGNPASAVTGMTMVIGCPDAMAPGCTAPLSAGLTGAPIAPVLGITAWQYPAMNPPAYVALAYFSAKNCKVSAQAAALGSNLGTAQALDLRVKNGVNKSGLLLDTSTGGPYVGGAAAIKSAAVVVVAGEFQCGDNVDSDSDSAINDGCGVAGLTGPETTCGEAACADVDGERPWDACDDDADGAINDGCAQVGGTPEQLMVLDPPNNQWLACGNLDTTPVTGWEGKLDANWRLIPDQFSFAIDANPWNDANPCASIDATHSVNTGADHEVAVCSVNEPRDSGGTNPDNVNVFTFFLNFDKTVNKCKTNPICDNTATKCLDDNPDVNAGTTFGTGHVPTTINLGGGWDCGGAGTPGVQPWCDDALGQAKADCLSPGGPWTSGGLSPFPLAIVSFNAFAVGIDTMTTTGNVWSGKYSGEADPPPVSVAADVDKHIAYTPTPLPPSCDLSVVKTDAPDPVMVGSEVTYTITVKNNDPVVVAGIPAEDVELVDTLPPSKVYVADSATCDTGTCTEAGNVVTCDLGDIAIGDSVVCTIKALATTLGVSTNVVTVTTDTPDSDEANNSDSEDTLEVSSGVRMVKVTSNIADTRLDVLWIMRNVCDPDKPDAVRLAEGKGCLAINKMVYNAVDVDSPNDSDSVAEGVGTWEEQIKYDHKLLTVKAVPNNAWLESGGRKAICTMTILTENWILTGCVTKDGGAGWGAPGPNGDGLIETIYLYPKTEDLIYRQGFRPTKDNGVRTDLVDENCEVADTLGEKIPGTLPGGLTTECGDAHITMRMLEGDVNLDCVVNCIDDQAIAFRYGTFFGLTLYDEWYDLAPECTLYPCDTNDDTVVDAQCEQCTTGVPDFDIDIKDLQFVFGRNYSTCQAPIPNLQGVPMLPPQEEFE